MFWKPFFNELSQPKVYVTCQGIRQSQFSNLLSRGCPIKFLRKLMKNAVLKSRNDFAFKHKLMWKIQLLAIPLFVYTLSYAI